MTPRQSPATPKPLAAANAVFRSRSGAFDALHHVVNLASAYLDGATPSRWSLERAVERGFSPRMLARLAHHEAVVRPIADPFYHAHLASKCLDAAIHRADDVAVVRWLCCEYCPSVVPVKAMVEAASLGRLRVLQWLLERYFRTHPTSDVAGTATDTGSLALLVQNPRPGVTRLHRDSIDDLLQRAAILGHLDVARWLYEQHTGDGEDEPSTESQRVRYVLGFAIQNGHYEIAQFLADAGYQLDWSQKHQLALCAAHGNLELIQWLHAHELSRGTTGWANAAAAAGHLDIVQWVHDHMPEDACTEEAMDGAAGGGHLAVVQWLHENRSEGCTTRAMDDAAENGHLEVVQWFHAHRREGCTTQAMDGAAENGHLEIVQWLHANRTEGCSTRAMEGAAWNGHFDVVQWLHAHRSEGCTTWAMDYAASYGHLEIVKFLHANRTEGCTTVAMDSAAESGHLEVVKWLHANRAEGCTVNAMHGAAGCGHLEIVKWLHENRTEGCVESTMEWAAYSHELDVVKWLHENRTEGCSTAAMDTTDSLEILQWLHENRSEGCTAMATLSAVHTGNFEKLLFLRENKLVTGIDDALSGALEYSRFEIFQWLCANYPDYDDIERAKTTSHNLASACEWMLFFEITSGREAGDL